jgi:hypothetical protein
MNRPTTPSPYTILEGVPRIGYDIHLCPFPGSLFACLKYIGDPQDYDYLMGASGAAFRRFWNRDDGGNVDLSYLGDEPFRRVFEAIGYEYRTIPAEKDAMIRAIQESIARGVPPISFGIIGPPEAGIVAGYQGEGDQLFGWSYFQEGRDRYYEKSDWFETLEKGAGKGLIIIGAKKPARPAERASLVASLEWAVDLARTPARPCFPNHFCGLAAYDGWADGLEVDADFPADNDPVMETRSMVHGDQVVMLHERESAAHYLRLMLAAAPEAAGQLNAAALLFEKAASFTSALWPWNHTVPGGAKKAFVDAGTRRSLAGHVRSAKAAEAQAVEHLEQALTILR